MRWGPHVARGWFTAARRGHVKDGVLILATFAVLHDIE